MATASGLLHVACYVTLQTVHATPHLPDYLPLSLKMKLDVNSSRKPSLTASSWDK